ncbi:DsrE family protein [Methyloceanibacter sp. wino2]|uniref:DsrE family protein n=1 Tax=Methyloceanibacter sp. wino2 TaxID=2170729 RepID=UPI000D3ECB20|nr:DsrE family protein [Methyloceanibacter sp. wino2]
MKYFASKSNMIVAFALAVLAMVATAQPAISGDKDPLFVSLVSDDAHAATMALSFAKTIQDEGHPVTVFFNNRGVLVASKGHTDTYPEQQKQIADLTSGGAVLLACPHCMKYYGLKDENLVDGVKEGDPKTVTKQLFMDGTKTLTW